MKKWIYHEEDNCWEHPGALALVQQKEDGWYYIYIELSLRSGKINSLGPYDSSSDAIMDFEKQIKENSNE